MNTLPTLAFFDSGIGGLALIRYCSGVLPAHYIYYADNAHMPYGNKSAEFIHHQTNKVLTILSYYNPLFMLIACFSASTHLKNNKYHAISMFDLFKDNTLIRTYKKIGIIATQTTVDSGIFQHSLRSLYPDCTFIQQACPLLASAIEHGESYEVLGMLVKDYLQPLVNQSIKALILGCTHYELIRSLIIDYLDKSVSLISTQDLLVALIKKNFFVQDNKQKSTLTILSSQQLCFSYDQLLLDIARHCTIIQKKVL